MRSVERIADVRSAVDLARSSGQRIGLVPTMGALHAGHLSLVGVARELAPYTVMSLFVNPLQFGPREDFTRYPRERDADAEKATRAAVDLLFCPSVEEMYPHPMRVTVQPDALAGGWEGALRPGHFAGVLTVVAKLFGIIRPDVAVFGQKDIQQALLIQAMVADLALGIEIVVVPTVRERDGLALSSRNAYLDVADRARAVAVPRCLRAIDAAWRSGERRADVLEATGRAILLAESGVEVQYLGMADPVTLARVSLVTPGTIAMVAARVGPTRLIDNIILGDSPADVAAGAGKST